MAQAVFTMLLCEKCDQPYEVVYRGDSVETSVIRNRCLTGRLSSLPLMVIYNIMEFMHHDWFANIIEEEEEDYKGKGMVGSSSSSSGRSGTYVWYYDPMYVLLSYRSVCALSTIAVVMVVVVVIVVVVAVVVAVVNSKRIGSSSS